MTVKFTQPAVAKLRARTINKNQEDVVIALKDHIEADEPYRDTYLDGNTPGAFTTRFRSNFGNRDGL